MVAVLFLIGAVPVVVAQSGPGTALFTHECQPDRIRYFQADLLVMDVPFSTIAAPLATAIATGQNQPVETGQTVSLWALKTDELQIHLNDDPANTRYVLPSSICGVIATSTPAGTGGPITAGALAYVKFTGPGTGFAMAQVGPDGQVITAAGIVGVGEALAYAYSTSSNPPSSERFHIVQPQENLFRIALRYNTTVETLAALNGITNPRLIYVGQKIYLP